MRACFVSLIGLGLLTQLATAQPAAPAPAPVAPPPAVTPLVVSPPEVNLSTSRAKASFVIQATYSDGLTRDVTDTRRLSSSLIPPSANWEKQRPQLPLRRRRNGSFVVEHGGRAITVPISVKDAKVETGPSRSSST